MRNIVAAIQSEQDELMRAELDESTWVPARSAPGTHPRNLAYFHLGPDDLRYPRYHGAGRCIMTTSSTPRRQAPLKVDPAVDELISSGANFLGITKKDLVAEAVQFYLDARREEMRERMRTLMRQLDGTRASRVALLSGLSREQLEVVGGVDEKD
jgi:hypothetical protein